MLSKPGEARKSSTPSQRRRTKVVEENSDDVVRRLQRLPPNKACADCSSKMTQCVNLTHGTFVCMACSGVHREFNHKIKGIGHSSFTPDEVAKLRHPSAGNEAVNSLYLARHTPSDRMKPPRNNTDLQHLRSWIQQKYIDKHWCENKGRAAGGGRSSAGSAPKPSSNGRVSRSTPSGQTSRRKIMPKAKVHEPSRAASSTPAPAPAAAADPFGFDSIAPASAPANDTSWDAFGGSTHSAASSAFDADFGNMNSTPVAAPPPPVAAPPPPAAGSAAGGFQADFGNFSQQPTVVSMPPAGQAVQQPQQRMQAGQPSFQANFDQASAMQQQVQQQQPNQMQGFADFGAAQPPKQQQQPQMQQHNQSNQQGFANFSSMPQPQQQMQQPTQPQMGQAQTNMQMQGTGMMGSQQPQGGMGMNMNQTPQQQPNQQGVNFGQFPQQSIQMQHHQQPQMQQGDQSGFANFSSIQPQQQNQPSQPQTQAQQQSGAQPGGMGQPPPQPSMAPPPQRTQNGEMQQGTGTMNAAGGEPNEQSAEPKAVSTEEMQQTQPSASSEPPKESDQAEGGVMNPNAFRSMDDEKKSAFDAFDNLSLEPAPASFMGGSTTPSDAGAPAPGISSGMAKTPAPAPYHEGQSVLYNNSEGSCLATISKVHHDDKLHPYYTIAVNGREKQTDAAHLSLPVESNANTATPGNLLQEATSMLQTLDPQQLMQVKQFIASIASLGTSSAPPSGQNLQMNNTYNQQQQKHMSFGSMNSTASSMGDGLPAAPMGGAPMPPSQAPPPAPAAQMSMQQQPMGMGMNNPGAVSIQSSAMPQQPPQAPTGQIFSNHGMPQQQQGAMGVATGMSAMNNMTVVQPQPAVQAMSVVASGQAPGAPAQFSNQMNQGMPPQGMGMGAQVGAQSPPTGIPPHPSAQAPPSMGQMAQLQSTMGMPPHQQPMGMGLMNSVPAAAPQQPPPAPPAAAPELPPVEKEGNPFDFPDL